MKFISTRGQAEPVDFVSACLAGLAPDGGLYVPETYPNLEPAGRFESYPDVAARVLSAFAGDSIPHRDLLGICQKAYASFDHQCVAPLVQYGPGHWLLELHHGPTLAFKDVAMQMIGLLFDYCLGLQNRRMTVVCATSGDTGGAAAAAFAGTKHANLIILHPHERISPVQRMFMTTTGADNVTNLALDSDFDTCQAIVKSLFADREFATSVGLSGVNSINWARIVAQMVYYATVQAALAHPLRFVVPSGNMGDALAGYVAARCGLLTDGFELVCAVNENDALKRLFESGRMTRKAAVSTPSPAMDISVPSNFERLLFEMSGRDAEAVAKTYAQYAQSGDAALPENAASKLNCSGMSVQAVGNESTREEMRQIEQETGWLICPHTAVGTRVARQLPESEASTVVFATASAAKFPETVQDATGRTPGLPERAKAVLDRDEAFDRIDASLGSVRAIVQQKAS